jgi:enoyl-CoA hydratase
MTDQPELVHLDIAADADGVAIATITLDSQHNRNAISRALQRQLMAHLDTADLDESVRAIVIRAEGPVFCSGADMAEAASGNMEKGTRRLVALQRKIVTLAKPVVVRVHGPVRAGGLGIVAACDVAISADTVSYAFTEVRLGLAPAVISLTVLPRLTDRSAAHYFLTADSFDAAEAERIGLVLRVLPDGELLGAAYEVAGQIVANSPWGVRMTKEVMWSQLEVGSFRAGIDLENRTQVLSSFTGDMEEAVRAFMEKRPARYTP